PNEFIAGRPVWAETSAGGPGRAESLAGRLVNFCFYEIADSEALVIEFVPPQSFMWIFELGNYWMNSVDYRYHFSSLNSEQAAVDSDGRVRIVVSNSDPGISNWLDPAGHRCGLLVNRWVGANGEHGPPAARIVKVDSLRDALPETARLSGDE